MAIKLIDGPDRRMNKQRVDFRVETESGQFFCAITYRCLQDEYGADDLISCFNDNLEEILKRTQRGLFGAPDAETGEPCLILRSSGES